MHTITIRKSAGEHSLVVQTAKGQQHYDLSNLNRDQLSGVREMVVNYFCNLIGEPPLYPNTKRIA